LAERIQTLKNQGLAHSLKKAPGGKKRKKDVATESTNSIKQAVRVDDTSNEKAKKAPAIEAAEDPTRNVIVSMSQFRSNTTTPLSGIKNAATASLTARVLDEQEEKNKRRKLGLNDNLKSLFAKTGSDGSTQKREDFMTRGYSIPRKT
jgi:hypothetical protein